VQRCVEDGRESRYLGGWRLPWAPAGRAAARARRPPKRPQRPLSAACGGLTCSGAVTVAEIAIEINGHLGTGPPETRAGRRTVGLPGVVVAELAAHVAEYVGQEADALVFQGEWGGQLRPVTFRPRIWRPATRAAGLDGLHPHDLRHTAVALWIAAGASPKEVAVRAGHTSVKTVLDVYGHLYDEADTRLRSRLDAVFVAPSTGPSAAPAEQETAPGRPPAEPVGPANEKDLAWAPGLTCCVVWWA